MKSTVALTLAVFCTLYTAARTASLARENPALFDITGNELRNTADKLDRYDAFLTALAENGEFQSVLKRSGVSGCGQFGGCSQLKLGQDAFSRMLASDNTQFGVGGPGKRRRSVDAVAAPKA